MKEIKNKNCKACGGEYKPRASTQQACSTVCAIAWSRAKEAKKLDREQNKAHRLAKKIFKASDIQLQLNLTQKAFNKMRKLEEIDWFRTRGLEPECISCGKTNMDWCCGHFKTVGSQGALRFDRINTYLQCNRYCNMGKSGNINGCKNTRGYLKGLSERFGEGLASVIVQHCEVDTVKKWTCEELIKIRKEFNSEIKRLGLILRQ